MLCHNRQQIKENMVSTKKSSAISNGGDPLTTQILKEMNRLKEIRNDIDNKLSSLQSLLNHHLLNSSSSSTTIDDLPTPFVSRELPYLSQHVLIQIPRDISRSKHNSQLSWTTRSGVPRPKKNHVKGKRKHRKKKADKLCQLLQGLELKEKTTEQQPLTDTANQNSIPRIVKVHIRKGGGSQHKSEGGSPHKKEEWRQFYC